MPYQSVGLSPRESFWCILSPTRARSDPIATKSDRDMFRALHDETAKAIRRGEKFARSLKRVVARRNPDTSLQPLLDPIEKGLATLGAEAAELKRIGWPNKWAGKTRGKSKPVTATSTGKAKAGRKASKTRAKGSGPKTGNQPSPQSA